MALRWAAENDPKRWASRTVRPNKVLVNWDHRPEPEVEHPAGRRITDAGRQLIADFERKEAAK